MAPGEYLRLLNTAIFKSPMLDACGGLMIRRAHEPADLTLGSALKETQLVIEASEDLNAVMPLAELLHHRLEAAAVQGWGVQDLTVLSRSCRLSAGLEDLESREAAKNPLAEGPPTKFTAQSREGRVELDLKKITHFEIIKDAVWAWTQGKRYCTSWKHLTEVERAFGHIAFLRIHRHILLQPEAAMARKASSGAASTALGGGKSEPFPGLEEHLLTHAIELDENLESPELKAFSQADLEKLAARPPFPDKRSPTGWGNLIERSFGHIPFLRLQRPVPEKPMVVQIQNNLTGETLKTFGEEKKTAALPRLENPQTAPSTKVGEKQEPFALEQTTHFEMEHDVVWAWVQGKRVRTGWRSLAEVEAAFSQVILLKIQRHILLHPETVLSIHPAFGGRAKVKVAGDVELSVSRTAVPRLRELLGM
jgi:hypothetical protein